MGAKESKQFPISYEEAVRRGKSRFFLHICPTYQPLSFFVLTLGYKRLQRFFLDLNLNGF